MPPSKEAIREQNRIACHKYSRAHPERRRESTKNWLAKHPEKRRLYSRKYGTQLHRDIIDHYGGRCTCCGETELSFLCIDHINGGGKKQSLIVGLGKTFYNYLKKNNYLSGYQVLCYNCNHGKELRDGCPHQRNKIKKESLT